MRNLVERVRARLFPEQVARGVLDAVMAITITGEYGSRLKFYNLPAAAFGLK
jgi:hypothetical protein